MRNIYLGDRGVLVQYLQLALTRAGYPVELDCWYYLELPDYWQAVLSGQNLDYLV